MELNQITVYGNLVNNPDGRRTNSGQAVATFRIAINRKSKGQDFAVFIDVTAWNKTAEFCRDYLRKGSPVVVVGRLDMDTWDDNQTGAKRSKLYITASSVQSVIQAHDKPQAVPSAAAPFPGGNKPAPPPFPGTTPAPETKEPAANSPADLGYEADAVDDIPF